MANVVLKVQVRAKTGAGINVRFIGVNVDAAVPVTPTYWWELGNSADYEVGPYFTPYEDWSIVPYHTKTVDLANGSHTAYVCVSCPKHNGGGANNLSCEVRLYLGDTLIGEGTVWAYDPPGDGTTAQELSASFTVSGNVVSPSTSGFDTSSLTTLMGPMMQSMIQMMMTFMMINMMMNLFTGMFSSLGSAMTGAVESAPAPAQAGGGSTTPERGWLP